MNRNGQLIQKSESYAAKLEELMKSMANLLENPEFLKAMMKADTSGHLHSIRSTSGVEALKGYLCQKAKEDAFGFGQQLLIAAYEYRHGMTKTSTQKLGDGPGQLGSHRVNPNLVRSEPGNPSNLPMEEPPKGETQAQKAQRVRAREILIKSECARHCRKGIGRAHCQYCLGMGYEARERLGENRSNQPRAIIR